MPTEMQGFLVAKSAAGLSSETLRWYEMFLTWYKQWAEERGLETRSPETIEAYMTHLRDTGKSAYTVSGCYRALRVYYRWLQRRKLIDASPLEGVQPPKVPHRKVKHVTEGEFRRLYDSIQGNHWLDARDRAILLILFFSGLRASELVALRVEDVNRVYGVLHVHGGKGDKDRDVPFIPDLLPELDDYLSKRPAAKHGYLFIGYGNNRESTGPLTYEGLKEIVRRRCAKAGMPRLGLHSFRHGYAMLFLNAGMDIYALSQSLGHSSIEITRRFYADWTLGGMAREYNKVLQKLHILPNNHANL